MDFKLDIAATLWLCNYTFWLSSILFFFNKNRILAQLKLFLKHSTSIFVEIFSDIFVFFFCIIFYWSTITYSFLLTKLLFGVIRDLNGLWCSTENIYSICWRSMLAAWSISSGLRWCVCVWAAALVRLCAWVSVCESAHFSAKSEHMLLLFAPTLELHLALNLPQEHR